jgi:phage minor structural protein
MIPTLYDKTGNNKIGVLSDCIECLVEEERNGIFELTMIYPANSSILESIVYDNIIVADANDYLKSQKFRVYNTRKLMANRIEVCARHISFDLVHDWVDVISIENQSCEYALNTIFRNSQFSKHFKGHSDIVNAQNFKVNKVTCLEAIGGTDGSIIDTYGTGAEILRDNTDIHVLNRRGHDNDVTIEYRKNLTGLEVEEDTTDLVTRIMPYAIYTNSNNEEVEVRGDFINSPLINNYAHPYVKYMDYSEEFEDGEVPTKTKLNNLATKEYTINKIDIPKCNYKIEFIPLSKCAGYEGLEDRINLCDVVTIKDSRYNIDTQAKVIKVVFDVLRGRYDSMELGEPRTTLGDIIGGTGDGPTQGPPGPPGPQGPAGADGSIGDFPETLPEVPNITAKVYGFSNIELSWIFENKVYYSYELYASKTKGFTPNTFNLIFSGQASTYLFQAEPSETWYFRACALNTHGQRTEFSSEVEVSTVKISDLSNYVESAAIGDALIGELNLGRGWYGELKGNYIDARQLSVTDGSGKRTLDIDSFGNVNLDVTSLKIKNNSVATESFVSNAKNDAINSANNNTAIALENHYTKSETDSKISVAKDEINLGVSNTYETKTNVETKINNISVGGRNYVRDYMFGKQDVWKRNRTSESFIDTDNGYGYLTASTANPWLYQIMPFNVFKKGQAVTIQYEIKCEDVSKNTSSDSMLIRTVLTGYESDSGGYIKDVCILGMHENEVANLTSWTKKTITRTIGDIGAAKSIWLRLYARNFTGKIYFRNVKLELGTKVTDLSPAPEDISADINTAKNDAITSANNKLNSTIANYYTKSQTDSQINVAKNAITQSVSSTYATKTDVTSSINGVNSSISSLTTRMSSAESKITDTAITNTVKKNFYTKTETENAITSKGYATQSQLQQTANDFQFKFTQSGGYNLVRNGNPKPNNYNHWWVSGNGWWYLGDKYDIGIGTTDVNEAYAGSAVFKVQKNCAYSFSCWLFAEQNTKGADVYFIGSSKDDGAYEQATQLFTGGKDGWTKVEATFTTGSNIEYGFIRIDNNGALNTSGYNVVFFSEVQVVKGSNCYPQWSPNPNEVYDGITTIDKNGVTVSSSNINGYTCMTSWGFFVNKDGKDLVSVDGYGLRLFDAKIQLTHANGNKYFLLDENGIVMYNPANGTHQWGKVAAINNKFTVASNGNSSGLSLGHHVNENYVEDILCDSNGVVSVQRQMNHNGVFYNNYGQMFVRQPGQGGWEITGRSDSQSIKPGGANQGGIGSNTQYINQSWIANRQNPSSLEIKHLSHYVDDLECLKLVSEVQPARYFYKEYDEDGNDITTFTTRTSQLGLIYEDVRECTGRDLITNEEDKAINLYNMVSTLWGAVRNLNKRLNELEVENLDLKSKLTAVEDL